MDKFIKKYLSQNGSFSAHSIEPSGGFVKNTMAEIGKIERGRILTSRILIVILSLLPFSIKITWSYIRGDYFSLSSMPLNQYLYAAYHIFMTTSATYVLLIAGIGMVFYLYSKNRTPLQRIVG